ncbi:MAG: fumarylacetoacetate hydrolase family protein, partial [Polaromonas sp.]|nr:fumarylacetoacetate hydrolase family protein [Polaromonas sp.]
MKLATFISPRNGQVIGCVDTPSQTVFELQAAHRRLRGQETPFFTDMLALIDAGEEGLALAGSLLQSGPHTEDRHALSAVRLLSPVPVPRQIRDFNNAEAHMRNAPAGIRILRAKLAGQPVPERSDIEVAIPDVNFAQPIFYISNRFNVVGTDTDVQWPGYSQWLDYEAEFGFFVGRSGKDISAATASEHIFGYTVFNDFSARDKQIREMEGSMGPTKGKSFDTGNAIGPWI